MKKNKGFTLIELLVVIAIIGILASVVLAALGSARNKGKDAAVQSELSSLRAQAEIVANAANGSYAGVFSDPQVISIVAGVDKNSADGTHVGNVSATAWAAEAKLSTGNFFCVDNNGTAKTETAALGTATACQ